MGKMLPTTILIVEDDTALRELYAERFRVAGFNVITAGDGEDALRVATTKHPNVILLDIMLPRMGGLEVLETLRADEQIKTIPVAVMTAYDLEEYRLRVQPYADKFLLKSEKRPVQMVEEVQDLMSHNNQVN